jgi:hypothetical protein
MPVIGGCQGWRYSVGSEAHSAAAPLHRERWRQGASRCSTCKLEPGRCHGGHQRLLAQLQAKVDVHTCQGWVQLLASSGALSDSTEPQLLADVAAIQHWRTLSIPILFPPLPLLRLRSTRARARCSRISDTNSPSVANLQAWRVQAGSACTSQHRLAVWGCLQARWHMQLHGSYKAVTHVHPGYSRAPTPPQAEQDHPPVKGKCLPQGQSTPVADLLPTQGRKEHQQQVH